MISLSLAPPPPFFVFFFPPHFVSFLLQYFTPVVNWWGHSRRGGNTECDFIILINLPRRAERKGIKREGEGIDLVVGFMLDMCAYVCVCLCVCVCVCVCVLTQRLHCNILGGKYPLTFIIQEQGWINNYLAGVIIREPSSCLMILKWHFLYQ